MIVLIIQKTKLKAWAYYWVAFIYIRIANTHAPGTLPILWHQSLLVRYQR
jgi:hypothetical protein